MADAESPGRTDRTLQSMTRVGIGIVVAFAILAWTGQRGVLAMVVATLIGILIGEVVHFGMRRGYIDYW